MDLDRIDTNKQPEFPNITPTSYNTFPEIKSSHPTADPI